MRKNLSPEEKLREMTDKLLGLRFTFENTWANYAWLGSGFVFLLEVCYNIALNIVIY